MIQFFVYTRPNIGYSTEAFTLSIWHILIPATCIFGVAWILLQAYWSRKAEEKEQERIRRMLYEQKKKEDVHKAKWIARMKSMPPATMYTGSCGAPTVCEYEVWRNDQESK